MCPNPAGSLYATISPTYAHPHAQTQARDALGRQAPSNFSEPWASIFGVATAHACLLSAHYYCLASSFLSRASPHRTSHALHRPNHDAQVRRRPSSVPNGGHRCLCLAFGHSPEQQEQHPNACRTGAGQQQEHGASRASTRLNGQDAGLVGARAGRCQPDGGATTGGGSSGRGYVERRWSAWGLSGIQGEAHTHTDYTD